MYLVEFSSRKVTQGHLMISSQAWWSTGHLSDLESSVHLRERKDALFSFRFCWRLYGNNIIISICWFVCLFFIMSKFRLQFLLSVMRL